jgi:hypothetical protein
MLAVLAIAGCGAPPDYKDVAAFVERRQLCEHFAGEIPGDSNSERQKELIDSANKHCAGIDAMLDALKSKYAKHGAITEKLNSFEPVLPAISP